uniref:Uncharacterized protein LOC113797344 isoform X1 n=1 Tax=Dermatophagoides pteronyssinus TaxID=6956 RepID=A0A6P6YE32_DERPT|nr:uncharacterized protein LOC113797344 isoform X1 [Dermatophagoides pteronyssinus]
MPRSRGKSMTTSNSASNLSSIHPWYYVTGDKYSTEKRLANKHEFDSNRCKQNEQIDRYYRRWNRETKLMDNWDQNKSMVRHHRSMENLNVDPPPFYIEDDIQIEMNQKRYENYMQKMTEIFRQYHQVAKDYRNNFIDTNMIVDYLLRQAELDEKIEEKRNEFFSQWNRHVNRCFSSKSTTLTTNYNYQSDPLRQICFAIRKLLRFYKSIIDDNQNRLNIMIIDEKLFTIVERNELVQLNDRCLQIIDIYLNLNESRDNHFQTMFYEEREKQWPEQCRRWSDEIAVWDNLFIKLFDSNYQLLYNRLDKFLEKQRCLLQERLSRLQQLQNLIHNLENDKRLQSIVYIDIDKFL